MLISPSTAGPRSLIFQVNQEAPESLTVGGGSANQPSSSVLPIQLQVGYNKIQFGNSASPAPDLDRISIIGNSFALRPQSTGYESELAQLSGTEAISDCTLCSGGAMVTSITQDSENWVSFPNVIVPTAGPYELEIDYVANGQHSFSMTVNDGNEVEIDLTGSSGTLPGSTVVPVSLRAGTNTLKFNSHDLLRPALDRIAVAPILGSMNLTTSVLTQSGQPGDRVWTLEMANVSDQPARDAQINLFALTESSGQGTCQPRLLEALPLNAGTIPKQSHIRVPVHLDFSKCSDDARFNATIVFSSNNGATVGDTIESSMSR